MNKLGLSKSTIFRIIFIVAIIAIIIGLIYVVPLVLDTVIAIIIYLLTAALYTALVFGIPFVCYRLWNFRIAMFVAIATTIIACVIVLYTQPNIGTQPKLLSPAMVIETAQPPAVDHDQAPEVKPQDVEPPVSGPEPEINEPEPQISEPNHQIEESNSL